jgi:two-component system, NarL family, nitrate/nitrite response regulator NarL
MTRIFVLAEIRLYRDGLTDVLRREPGIEIVGAAGSWEEAAPLLRSLRPEIVVVDMATTGGLHLVGAIRALEPTPKVVALAVPDAEDEVLACAAAGVSGYVTREDSLETMVAAIQSVARGELLCTPRMAAVLFDRVRTLMRDRPELGTDELTPREREVLGLIGDGLSNKAIAQRLRIELPTVKNHVHNILEKLRVHRRADAAARFRASAAAPSVLQRASGD